MKILHLDIETAPHVVHVWGLFNQNVSTKQVINSGYTLCWAAKWDGTRNVMFSSIFKTTARKMIAEIHGLVSEADAVVHYNGNKFDMPTLNKEFLIHEMPPPAPYRNIDLYRVCRQTIKVPSYKLDYIAKMLKIGGKINHKGHELWIGCMEKDSASWRIMERYNKQDVRLLEKLYHRLMGWIQMHPNQNVYNDDGERVCVNCGSNRITKKNWAYTGLGKYKRFVCRDCGKWMRGRFTMLSKETRETMLASARN
jgi:DNA polymerase elongation subunit (family B)